MHQVEHYTLATVALYLSRIPKLLRWLRARKITSLGELTLQDLKAAHHHFRARHNATSAVVDILERFLRTQKTVPEGEPPALGPVLMEKGAEYSAISLSALGRGPG